MFLAVIVVRFVLKFSVFSNREFKIFNAELDDAVSGQLRNVDYCNTRVVVNQNAFVYILPSEVTNSNK
jgi:hypothetical protein